MLLKTGRLLKPFFVTGILSSRAFSSSLFIYSASASASSTTKSDSTKYYSTAMSSVTVNLEKLGKVDIKGPVNLQNYTQVEQLESKPVSSLLQNDDKPQDSLIFIIRRLGCPVCRTTALIISSVGPQLRAKGITLNCLTFQVGDELRQFLENGYFVGDHYLDQKKEAYEVTETSGIFGVFKLFFNLFFGLSDGFKARMRRTNGNYKEVTTVYSTILGIKDGKIVFEQKYVEDPNIEGILKGFGIEGEDFKNAMESYQLNLNASGDKLVGPACSIENKQCS